MSPNRHQYVKSPHRKHCPVTVGFNLEGKAKPIYCGQWMCDNCAKRLAKKWAKRVRDHITNEHSYIHATTGDYPPDYWFITLTLGSAYKTTGGGFKAIPKLWDKLRNVMQYRYKGWQYVAFVEGQPQRGYMPHFHIISNYPLPITPNKHGKITKHATHDYAHKMGWGYEADQSQVPGAKHAAYCSKYASKQSPKTPRGFRRVRASRKWRKLEKDPARRLIVKGRGEGVADFIIRVSEVTGLTNGQAYTLFYEQWELHKDKLGPAPRKW